MSQNFFISIPHAGEQIPAEVTWLAGLPLPTLMRDVDRFVDQLYQPIITELALPAVIAQWHRYVVDLNRFEDEYDGQAVAGATLPPGTHPKGLHWSVTTEKETLIAQPMAMDLHELIIESYYRPFHQEVRELRKKIRSFGQVYQLDAHSMPSLGTSLHLDPGERRADIVISDYYGGSCSSQYRDAVLRAFQRVGFEVAYNYPYVGGGITRMYGEPAQGCHTIQVEINRDLYMDETTKEQLVGKFAFMQKRVSQAVKMIYNEVSQWA